jgi:hypothetical protein
MNASVYSFATQMRHHFYTLQTSCKPSCVLLETLSCLDQIVQLGILIVCLQFIPAFVMPTALWLLGNALHLARSNDFNTYPRYNIRLNHHLRVDAWFQLLVGVAWLAFPGHISPLLVSISLFIVVELLRSFRV